MTRQAAGLIDDARGLAATGVRAVRTRLELLEIEIATEKTRLVRALELAAAAFYLLSFGGVLAVLWVAQALPAEWRLTALGLAALMFLGCGVAALAWLLRTRLPRPFLATIVAVLKRDEAELASRSP